MHVAHFVCYTHMIKSHKGYAMPKLPAAVRKMSADRESPIFLLTMMQLLTPKALLIAADDSVFGKKPHEVLDYGIDRAYITSPTGKLYYADKYSERVTEVHLAREHNLAEILDGIQAGVLTPEDLRKIALRLGHHPALMNLADFVLHTRADKVTAAIERENDARTLLSLLASDTVPIPETIHRISKVHELNVYSGELHLKTEILKRIFQRYKTDIIWLTDSAFTEFKDRYCQDISRFNGEDLELAATYQRSQQQKIDAVFTDVAQMLKQPRTRAAIQDDIKNMSDYKKAIDQYTTAIDKYDDAITDPMLTNTEAHTLSSRLATATKKFLPAITKYDESMRAIAHVLTPQPNWLGKYFTSNEAATNRDGLILIETQIDRFLKWFIALPPAAKPLVAATLFIAPTLLGFATFDKLTPKQCIFSTIALLILTPILTVPALIFIMATTATLLGIKLHDKILGIQEEEDLSSYFPRTKGKIDIAPYYAAKPRPDAAINRDDKGFKLRYLGHAGVLMQMNGVVTLTDPVMGHLNPVLYPSKTKGVQGAQDQTIQEILAELSRGVEANATPPNTIIDFIKFSHNHRDHLDVETLQEISEFCRDNGYAHPTILLPASISDKDINTLTDIGFPRGKIVQLAWQEEESVYRGTAAPSLAVTAVPADHRSGRTATDLFKSSVNGLVTSSVDTKEIVYEAGDTRILTPERNLAIAVNIYSEWQHQVDVAGAEHKTLPTIINIQPAGPNYTRRDMAVTHKSFLESMLSPFHMAIDLAHISQKGGQHISSAQWLQQIQTVFVHHMRYELGPDRFHENFRIYQDMLKYLRMTEGELTQERAKEAKKLSWSSIFTHKKDFIIDGVCELKRLAQQIWPDEARPVDKLISYIDGTGAEHASAHVHIPAINQDFTTAQLEHGPQLMAGPPRSGIEDEGAHYYGTTGPQ